jgi:hypothetical protein
MNIAQKIASTIAALRNCAASGNSEWLARHGETLATIERNELPSGSGIDSGTRIDMERSTPEKLVFLVSFHHMNDVGLYDGWTEHAVTVRPSFVYGLDIRVSGPNRNDIKDYLTEVFQSALSEQFYGV